jgi:uncharacterized membrane protein
MYAKRQSHKSKLSRTSLDKKTLQNPNRCGGVGAHRCNLLGFAAGFSLARRTCTTPHPTVIANTGHIQGLGIVLTIILIWFAGLIANNVFGRRLIGLGHKFLERLPLIGKIYSPIKQFIEKIAMPQTTGFSQVVLAEYPSDGRWIVGFATGEVQLDDKGTIGQCVFVPTSPNPVTGWMVIFPPEKVRKTSMSVESAMQLIVSAGVVIPPELRNLRKYDLTPESPPKIVDFDQV